MGIFSKKDICCICEINNGKQKILDGYVCKECLRSCGGFYPLTKPFKTATKEDIQSAIDENKSNRELINKFVCTKKIGTYLEVDETNKLLLIPDGLYGKKINPKVYSYQDVLEYELLEDGESITKGGLGRAVAGGLLLGGVGAVVGGITGKKKTKTVINSLRIKITVKKLNNPTVYINLISTATKSGSIIYKSSYNLAQEILSVLSIITDNNTDTDVNTYTNSTSVADELMKLKQLVDSGVLTQEEFETQKSKVLSS